MKLLFQRQMSKRQNQEFESLRDEFQLCLYNKLRLISNTVGSSSSEHQNTCLSHFLKVLKCIKVNETSARMILKPLSLRWINFTFMEKCHLERKSFYFKLSKHSISFAKYQNMIWLQIFYPVLI